jgi:hypothetical protein
VEEVVRANVFGRWEALPPRYRFMLYAAMAFFAALAAGASEMRWATPAWVIAALGGLFLCIYAFPSVWRYLFYMGLLYVFISVGALGPLFYMADAPWFVGWGFVLHVVGILVAYNLVKDVVLHRRAYHVAALKDDKEAPYVPIGLWLMAIVAFVVITDISMVGFSRWAQSGDSLALYIGSEIILVGLLMYILNVPETAFGGKGEDFVPRVSLREITIEGKKVAKRIVKRTKLERPARRSVKAAEAGMRPKVLTGGTLECPACGSNLAIDVRTCPECYRPNEFAWCPVSEHYIIPCPSCGKPTVYGEESCSHCGHDLTLEYKCPNCLNATPLQRWERA